jgi:hypothetical protein
MVFFLSLFLPLWLLQFVLAFIGFALFQYDHTILYYFLNKLVFYGVWMSTSCPTPNLENWGVSIFVWNLTLDVSDLGDPASRYATASIV